MSQKYISIFAVSLIFLLTMTCMQTVEPEKGTLSIQLDWESESTKVLNTNDTGVTEKILREKDIIDEITTLRITLQPGNLTFVFEPSETNPSVNVGLGIYNISVFALNDSDLVLFSGSAEKVLVKPPEQTRLTLLMEAQFPMQSPLFIDLSEENTNTSGIYTVVWSSTPKTTQYCLEESIDSLFTQAVVLYTGADTSLYIEKKSNGTFFYRVQSANEIGVSPWSDVIRFIVDIPSDLVILTDSLPKANFNEPYAYILEAQGGTEPYTWSLSQGQLPDGLTLDPATGRIAGTPSAAGTLTFTVQVTDASDPVLSDSRTLSISISPPDVVITTSSPLPDGTAGTFYSQNIDATGGSGDWNWSMTSGTLPEGVEFVDFGETGRVRGTPEQPGLFEFTIQATDNVYTDLNDSKTFSLTIKPAILSILTTSLPQGKVGTGYNQTIRASGGTLPYNWSLYSGALPHGLSLNTTTGEISGTPSGAGTFNFNIQITDSGDPQQSDVKSFSITITPAELHITTQSPLPDCKAGTDYSCQLRANGGETPYTWAVINRSPQWFAEGLNLSSDGLLSGNINSDPETGQLTIQVTDNASETDSKTFELSITPGDLELLQAYLPDGTVEQEYAGSITYRYGTPPMISPWTFTGDLPPGLTIMYQSRNSSIYIGGTPTEAGEFHFTVTVRDSGDPVQTRTDSFTIIINE